MFGRSKTTSTITPPPAPATPLGPDASGSDPSSLAGTSDDVTVRVLHELVGAGALNESEVPDLLAEVSGDLVALAYVLLGRHSVARLDYWAALGRATGLPTGDPRQLHTDPALADAVDEMTARAFSFFPAVAGPDRITVWGADLAPSRRAAAEQAAGQRFHWVASDPDTVSSFSQKLWPTDAGIERLVATFSTADAASAAADEQINEVTFDDNAPVVQLVSRIVGEALRDRASDIHIEPLDHDIRVRYRVDGELIVAHRLPTSALNPLVSRLKIMSAMNIVEKRAPQDGQFSTVVDGRPLDVRVSTVATVFGEKVVLRLLDKSKSLVALGQLGMPPDTAELYSQIVRSPYGMVICAGPTGSGKTTTLYATLMDMNSTGKNITTIEDPVEYVFPGINQVSTNDRAGLTFATGLRALLRQDPDVILVGEVRDVDTARIAVQSALTGHFVLSSLHGNESVAALHRLLDMGIEAFLVASAVAAVVAQRLVRRICEHCVAEYAATPDEIAVFRQYSGGIERSTFLRGAGCEHCSGTGYRGRVGVYELLRITPDIRRLIVGWATSEEIRRLAIAQGMRPMMQEAMYLVDHGITTVPEVVRNLFTA